MTTIMKLKLQSLYHGHLLHTVCDFNVHGVEDESELVAYVLLFTVTGHVIRFKNDNMSQI